MPELPEPASAQSRFIATDREWLPCNVAHARMVLAKPTAWAGYEARYLYTAEQVRAAIQQATALHTYKPDATDVTDAEIIDAFQGSNFGHTRHRELLQASVLKKLVGYHCGHTITTIMERLGLIGKTGIPTQRGRALVARAYANLMVVSG